MTYVNEYKQVGNYIINRYNVSGSSYLVYRVFEPIEFSEHSHGSITTIDGQWYSDITTKRCTSEIANLPAYSSQRVAKYLEYYAGLRDKMQEIIFIAYPHLRDMPVSRSGDKGTVWVNDNEIVEYWGLM